MTKALGNLVFRGILGGMSIVATAVVTVFVQRYLNTTMDADTPPSQPAQPESREPRSVDETQFNSSDFPDSPDSAGSSAGSSADSETAVSTDAASEEQGDFKTRIMEQFWDKLNR